MTPPDNTKQSAPPCFNSLRRGTTYRATTQLESTVGEYLGLESPHGDRAMLLRNGAGTKSIPLDSVTVIYRAAA